MIFFLKETFPRTRMRKSLFKRGKSLFKEISQNLCETSLETRCAIFLKETFPYAYVNTKSLFKRGKVSSMKSHKISRDFIRNEMCYFP